MKLAIADSPNPPEVVEKLKEAWRKWEFKSKWFSAEVLTTDSLNSDAPAWDMVYRIVHLTDRKSISGRSWTFQKRPTVDALSGVPAWLRQKLLMLDQAGDYDTANERLVNCTSSSGQRRELLPLWEIDEYLAARKHLRGLPIFHVFFIRMANNGVRFLGSAGGRRNNADLYAAGDHAMYISRYSRPR